MKRINSTPHIAWLVFLVIVLLAFYLILALIGHVEPKFIQPTMIAAVVAVIALARSDVPPGTGD